jgi:hypothetical protein
MMKILRGKFLGFLLLPVIAGLAGLTVTSYFSARHYLFESMSRSGVNYLKAEAERIRSFIVKEQSILESIAVTHSLVSYDDARYQQIVDGVHKLLDERQGAIRVLFTRKTNAFFCPLPQD